MVARLAEYLPPDSGSPTMRLARIAIASALMAGMHSVSTSASAQETSPARPAPALPYVVSGAVLLGSSWAASYAAWLDSEIRQTVQCNNALASAQAHQADPDWGGLGYQLDAIGVCGSPPADRNLWIPLAGPWMTLAQEGYGSVARAFLVADGVAQGAGLALMAYGLLRRFAESPRSGDTTTPSILVQPGAGTSTAGLTVLGRF
jgi:hypothetical protein